MKKQLTGRDYNFKESRVNLPPMKKSFIAKKEKIKKVSSKNEYSIVTADRENFKMKDLEMDSNSLGYSPTQDLKSFQQTLDFTVIDKSPLSEQRAVDPNFTKSDTNLFGVKGGSGFLSEHERFKNKLNGQKCLKFISKVKREQIMLTEDDLENDVIESDDLESFSEQKNENINFEIKESGYINFPSIHKLNLKADQIYNLKIIGNVIIR